MAELVILAPSTALLGMAGSTLELTGWRLLQGVLILPFFQSEWTRAPDCAHSC